MTRQDTGKYRINTNDQFYTSDAVAKQCVQRILESVTTCHNDGGGVAPYTAATTISGLNPPRGRAHFYTNYRQNLQKSDWILTPNQTTS